MRGIRALAATPTVAAIAVVMTAGCAQTALSTNAKNANTPRPVPYAVVGELPETLAADGTTIVVGDPAAATTVRLYEDPRCPYVDEFASGAPVLRSMTLRREARTEYTFASFRDDRVGGDGSNKAVNALRAALEAGLFTEYHAVLLENMAKSERAGGYTNNSLLALADQVPGLRSEAFDSAVATMKYSGFVVASEKAYEAAGGDDPRGPGTPTVVINGTQITGARYGWLFEERSFGRLLRSARG
ncbi:DsbA family protein [Streptomyces sp. NBC_01264]|uniref:DsbA family protein n=1 Tax=Streptomyces sp. NBC_01264 TaxID=2903804 RepID=UPI00225C0A5C|nr:thioredoxin domain-containing protein [Streptomyces sp. NBC_01264]MCX4775383.1 DsbA family protein [Streptomyces sp. NBC_01264]